MSFAIRDGQIVPVDTLDTVMRFWTEDGRVHAETKQGFIFRHNGTDWDCIGPDLTDWVCEAHPDRELPHDDCPGPGMPRQRSCPHVQ